MHLRPYQERLLDSVREALRTNRRVLMSLPTGGGKTVIACAMIREAARRGHRCLFLAHRRELIHQASARLDVPHSVILAGEKYSPAAVEVASVQTLTRRSVEAYDFVFVDEAHHTAANSYRRILDLASPRWLVGLTATPYRTDGRGLGDSYDALVAGPTTLELTVQGYLAPCDMYSPPIAAMIGAHVRAGDYTQEDLEQRINRPRLVGDVVATWRKHPSARTVAFGVSVAHATSMAEAFRTAGVAAEIITGEMSHDLRAERLAALASGHLTVLATCGVLTEGWDCPAASTAIIARPTMSRGLWRQMAGRVLRTCPGKSRALILDHGGNAVRHGHIYAPDPAELQQSRHATRDSDAPATSVCPSCFGVYYRQADTACPYCGAVREVKPRRISTASGELERVDWTAAPLAKQPDDRARDAARELAAKARANGYKPQWVWFQLKLRYGPERARALMREAA